MRLGDLPRHPHYPKLLSEVGILLDKQRDVVIAKAGSSDEQMMRVAAGRCEALKDMLRLLTDAQPKNP